MVAYVAGEKFCKARRGCTVINLRFGPFIRSQPARLRERGRGTNQLSHGHFSRRKHARGLSLAIVEQHGADHHKTHRPDTGGKTGFAGRQTYL
jgi:hypothetical protein